MAFTLLLLPCCLRPLGNGVSQQQLAGSVPPRATLHIMLPDICLVRAGSGDSTRTTVPAPLLPTHKIVVRALVRETPSPTCAALCLTHLLLFESTGSSNVPGGKL